MINENSSCSGTDKQGRFEPTILFIFSEKIPNLIVFLNHLLLKNVVSTSVSGNIVYYNLDQLIHWQQLSILCNICLKKPKNKTKQTKNLTFVTSIGDLAKKRNSQSREHSQTGKWSAGTSFHSESFCWTSLFPHFMVCGGKRDEGLL